MPGVRWHARCWLASMVTGRDHSEERGLPATQPLRKDHAALASVLSGIVALADRVGGGHPVHPLLLAGALTWLDAFQRCHDQKIEAVLLPALVGGHAAVGPEVVSDLAREHQEARERVTAVRRLLAGSGQLTRSVGRLANECVVFLREHAVHEMQDVFSAADRALSAEDIQALWEAFRQIDTREIPPGERQALQALAAAIDPGRARDATLFGGGIVAAHVMRPRPKSARPADTLARAAELMERAGVRELPVAEEGRLCGIISRTDLQAHLGHLEWTSVEAAMTPEPVVVTPEQSAAAVSRVLLRGRFNAVPVIAEEKTLIGMVSRSDLLRAVAEDASGAGL